jgi:hypothetical protein
MVTNTEPIPYMKHGFKYGATSPREEALLKGLDASSRQAQMVREHTGGGEMTVPQFHTGLTQGPVNPNTLATGLNKSLTQHAANSEFDKLAISNKTEQKGGNIKKRGGSKKIQSRRMKKKTLANKKKKTLANKKHHK